MPYLAVELGWGMNKQMKFSYKELKHITNAKTLQEEYWEDKTFNISTDTRTIKKGDVYLPLKGESFDGEKFIGQAIEKGAAGFFTTTEDIKTQKGFGLLVKDTKIAYLQIANYYKNIVKPVTIAITGSSGKTTTKEIFGSIFEANKHTHKSKLNHNNEIGLCQTLLSMPKNTEILIVEMGMRAEGEIELLSKYAEPDFAVITNIGTAHIGRLGSRENIAKAKCEIVKHLCNNGMLITHSDELYNSALKYHNFKGTHKIIKLSEPEFKIISMHKDNSEFLYIGNEYKIKAGGEYIIQDALLAIETALNCNLTPENIQKGLNNYKSIEKRFEEIEVGGLKFINDSYNANPDSMKAAIKTFLKLYDGEKAVVLADMGELGENSAQYHSEIGIFLDNFEGFKLITIGELSKNISDSTKHAAKHFSDKIEALEALKELKKGTTVLLKGSRSMKLEELIEEMKK